jgi:hypothetical protein
MPGEESGNVCKLVEEMAKVLVESPSEVVVRAVEGEQGARLELRVASADMGRVIGRQGRTARSLRAVLGAAGTKLNKHFTLEIVE